MTSELPPGLQGWGPSLGFLTVEAALHLGPPVRRLDALIRRLDATEALTGEPDGFGGLSRRGEPERMLLSEWLLADELPMEFMRRAAAAELLHLRPVTRRPHGRGRVAVVADTGPDQLGASRLVQLAALIVLHRRAAARRSELVLGLAGTSPGTWREGDMPRLYEAWRAGHRADLPDPATLPEWLAGAAAGEEVWVLAGPRFAAGAAGHPRLLTIREAEWGEAGVTGVDVRLRDQRVRLRVPGGPVSVQALRGAALRRRDTAGLVGNVRLGGPMLFPSNDRRLVLRGERVQELLVATIPASPGREGRVRTHRFSAPVVAAAAAGRRLVALVRDGRAFRVRVVGKPLDDVAEIAFSLPEEDVGPPPLDGSAPLGTLLQYRGGLLWQDGDVWWHLRARRAPERLDLVAAGPSRVVGDPHRLELRGRHLSDNDTLVGYEVDRDALRVRVGTEAVAWSCDRRWYIRGHDVRPSCVIVDEEHEVLGLVTLDRQDDPALVTRSRAGMILRLEAEKSVKTLTRVCGPALDHAVHPLRPLLAIRRDEEHVQVADLNTGEVLATVRAG
jgi:hypothetical protein